MSEAKYGRLFTTDDVQLLLAAATGAEDPDDVEVDRVMRMVEGHGFELRFPADEPLFLLRGKDAAAQGVVWSYAYEAHRVGASPDFVTEAMKAANDMRDWADANQARVKVPD